MPPKDHEKYAAAVQQRPEQFLVGLNASLGIATQYEAHGVPASTSAAARRMAAHAASLRSPEHWGEEDQKVVRMGINEGLRQAERITT